MFQRRPARRLRPSSAGHRGTGSSVERLEPRLALATAGFATVLEMSDNAIIPIPAAPLRLLPVPTGAVDSPVIVAVATGLTTVETAPRSGGLTLVKRGPGTLVLAVANAHTGGVVVEEGEVVVRHVGGLGSGGLTVAAGASVRFDVGTALVAVSAVTLDPAARLDVGRGRFTVSGASGTAAAIPGRVREAAMGGWTTAAGIGSSAVTTQQRSVGVSWSDGDLTVG